MVGGVNKWLYVEPKPKNDAGKKAADEEMTIQEKEAKDKELAAAAAGAAKVEKRKGQKADGHIYRDGKQYFGHEGTHEVKGVNKWYAHGRHHIVHKKKHHVKHHKHNSEIDFKIDVEDEPKQSKTISIPMPQEEKPVMSLAKVQQQAKVESYQQRLARAGIDGLIHNADGTAEFVEGGMVGGVNAGFNFDKFGGAVSIMNQTVYSCSS
jgi:hypothetical protein